MVSQCAKQGRFTFFAVRQADTKGAESSPRYSRHPWKTAPTLLKRRQGQGIPFLHCQHVLQCVEDMRVEAANLTMQHCQTKARAMQKGKQPTTARGSPMRATSHSKATCAKPDPCRVQHVLPLQRPAVCCATMCGLAATLFFRDAGARCAVSALTLQPLPPLFLAPWVRRPSLNGSGDNRRAALVARARAAVHAAANALALACRCFCEGAAAACKCV